MPVAAQGLAGRAQDIIARLGDAIDAGRSAAHVQLICSELFEALRVESERPENGPTRSEMLVQALELCGRAGDRTIKLSLRFEHLRAIVALLQGGLAASEADRPHFRVIEGGLA